MPYIRQDERLPQDEWDIFFFEGREAGHLNYAITKLLCCYLEANGESYKTFNDCVGVLESAKLELYRRKIADYEDTKIEDNGDVYG